MFETFTRLEGSDRAIGGTGLGLTIVKAFAEAMGMDVEAANAKTALHQAAAEHPDAILLDLGLPDRDGLSIIPLLRAGSEAVILVVSARDAVDEKVATLDLGADG